jgi:hypothetical protein
MTLTARAVQRLTLAAACLAQGMMVLDVLIVSVALPSMQRELRLSPGSRSLRKESSSQQLA